MFMKAGLPVAILGFVLVISFLLCTLYSILYRNGRNPNSIKNRKDYKEIERAQRKYDKICSITFFISFALVIFAGEYSQTALIIGIIGVFASEVIGYLAIKKYYKNYDRDSDDEI